MGIWCRDFVGIHPFVVWPWGGEGGEYGPGAVPTGASYAVCARLLTQSASSSAPQKSGVTCASPCLPSLGMCTMVGNQPLATLLPQVSHLCLCHTPWLGPVATHSHSGPGHHLGWAVPLIPAANFAQSPPSPCPTLWPYLQEAGGAAFHYCLGLYCWPHICLQGFPWFSPSKELIYIFPQETESLDPCT